MRVGSSRGFLRAVGVWACLKSKHRKFGFIERIRYRERGGVEFYRICHHLRKSLDQKRGRSCDPVSPKCFFAYMDHGVELTFFEVDHNSSSERKALGNLANHGTNLL